MSEDVGRGETDERTGSVKSDSLRSDWSESGAPSTTIVEAMAAARGVDPVDLPKLNEYVDPDALDRLLTVGDPEVQVSFDYDGAEVFVASNGAVEVVID